MGMSWAPPYHCLLVGASGQLERGESIGVLDVHLGAVVQQGLCRGESVSVSSGGA
jgi:hypothetical protein